MRNIIEKQRSYFASGATRAYEFRMRQLAALEQAIQSNLPMIAAALRQDLGKSESEAISMEIGPTLEEIRVARKNLQRWMNPRRTRTPLYLQPGKSRIHPEPRGLVLIIAPWNYPFSLSLIPLVGAIAAGNCAIVKPSDVSHSTAETIEKLLSSTFPSEYVSTVLGGTTETTRLLEERFDHLFFTGSSSVGKIVMQAAAVHLTPVTLELGGKSPAIITASADLALAARRIAWGKFMNAGQTCIAPDYVYVHQSVKDRFCDLIAKNIRDFFGDNPRHSTSYGRIVSDRHFDRLERLLKGKVNQLGLSNERNERFFAPALVTDPTWQDALMQEEIFGPILPVFDYLDLDELLREIKLREKPLAAYIFSKRADEKKTFVENLSFGGGCINDTLVHIANPHLPFGGVGASGMGSYHGERSFRTFSHEKSVISRGGFLDLDWRYPPATESKLQWLRRIFRM